MKKEKKDSVYYIIEGVVIENSKPGSIKYKKVTFKFKNEEPKELRAKALKKFNEIKGHILEKKGSLKSYGVFNSTNHFSCLNLNEEYNIKDYSPISDIEKTELAFTLSFCITDNINNPEFIYKRYPIVAIGKILPKIEGQLKLNLILELQYYKSNNLNYLRTPVIKNFISKQTRNSIRSYIGELIATNIDVKNIYINRILLKNINGVMIIPTFQYSNKNIFENENILFLRKNRREYKNEILSLKRTFPFLNHTLNTKLSQSLKACFFTKEQFRINKLMNNSIKNIENIEKLDEKLENEMFETIKEWI